MGLDVESQKTLDEVVDRAGKDAQTAGVVVVDEASKQLLADANALVDRLDAIGEKYVSRIEKLVAQLTTFKATAAAGFYPDK